MENPWQDLLPKFELGEDWQQSFNQYTQTLRNQVEGFLTEIVKNSQNTAELLQIYIEEIQTLNQWWVNPLAASIAPLSQAAVTSPSQPWIELNHLYWNLAYEKTLGNLTQMPLLGPGRGLTHKLTRALDAGAKLYPTSVDYQIVLVEIQMQSFAELTRELISLAAKGETVKDWQQLLQLWSRTADKVFERAFCAEDKLKVRGRFLNAINQHKLCQQELTEVWMTMMNLPIRSEMDEVHRNIYELRKEVKSLKKTLTNYETQAQPTLSDPQQPPTQIGQRATATINRKEIGNHAAISDHPKAV